ncbi:hypothetical protein SDC9_205730 [bioreactor metagenome]|uniref:Uncharacterized protein n=1 Tax=bioreactor metagenome TaxID=1076179 RepID=A0A645JEL5_9ZZZZ
MVPPIFVGQLVILLRVVFPVLEAPFLLFFVDHDQELNDQQAVMDQVVFHFIDFIIGSGPAVFWRETFHPFNQYAAVPASVINGHLSFYRESLIEAPKIVIAALVFRRCSSCGDIIAAGVDQSR